MLQRMRQSGLVVPTLLTLVGLGILLALGTWQLQRKAWKDALTARIEDNIKSPEVPLENLPAVALSGADPAFDYRVVVARGRFDHGRERHVYAPDPRLGLGYHVLTPIELADGRVVIVNRGFVPERLKDTAQRRDGLTTGEVAVIGLLRLPPPAPDRFAPPPDTVRNVWFARDPAALAASMYPDRPGRVLPVVVDALAAPANAPVPGGWPKGGTTILRLPNRHLEYALTWYGLALTLVGVYAAYAWSRLGAARRTDGGVRYTSRPGG